MYPFSSTLRVKTSQSVTPVIAFLDVDSFECQIWQREQPHTRGMPCVVANTSGRIVAATYEAKALGVSRSETPNLQAAMEKCYGNLVVFRKPNKWGKQDQSKLRKATYDLVTHVQAFMKEYCIGDDIVFEVASSDEFYLDISAEVSRGMEQRAKNARYIVPGFYVPPSVVWERQIVTEPGPFFYRLPTKPKTNHLGMVHDCKTYSDKNEERLMFGALFLSRLCDYLEQKTGLQMSGGVASNKLLAKLGCGLNKPRKITVLYQDAFRRVSKRLDLLSIPGLGGATREKLSKAFGISKIGDILRVGYAELVQSFGKDQATRFTSWAMGQDVEPVVQKICKDQIRCNKSSGDVKTLTALKSDLKNLTSEICMLLAEEETRYGRKATQVKVEYKLADEKSAEEANHTLESKIFDIEEFESLKNLHETVLNYLSNLPIVSGDDFHFTELAFVLQNFIPINLTEEEFLYKAVENMFVSAPFKFPPTKLRVHVNLCDTAELPQFQHSVVGSFRMTSSLQYSTILNTDIPKLLNESDLQSLVGYELLRDFRPGVSCCKLIKDYYTYNELKHEFFSKWLLEEKCGNEALNDIKFVTFHGRLLRSLKTILNVTFGEWETYAMNVDGIIYLWDEESTRTDHAYNPLISYTGELFEQIVSGRCPTDEGVIDGFNRVFPIQKVKFGSHNLLLLNNVDAQDIDDGSFVQVQLQTDGNCFKIKNPSFFVERKMKLWSQAIVSGSKKVVIGYKNLENCITKMESISVDDLSSSVEDKDKCFAFLDRLLEWINGHLPNHNDKLVKKFSWMPGRIHITCTTIPEKEVEKLLIPKIYFPKK